MKTRVFKFGGSSFPTLESYRDIARYVVSRLSADTSKAVVVVSAMSGTTGRILESGIAVNPEMSAEITDSLLGTGEMLAAALMRTALEGQGARAMHLTGYQNGIRTNSNHTFARIESIDAGVIQNLFNEVDVVVVAGGQAVDEMGRMTMLGRNSSDLSAVALAGALGLEDCEIFSDVPGVYSADPYAIDDAQLFKEIPYDSIIEMSRSGAKVLHHGAVECAKRHGVRIVCRAASGESEIGSIIGSGVGVNSVTINDKVAVYQFLAETVRDAASAELSDRGLVVIAHSTGTQHFLVISKENRGWQQAAQAVIGSAEATLINDRVLLTELRANAYVKRYLLSGVDAGRLALALHSVHYGPQARSSGRVTGKARSSWSGVLVGA